MFAYLLAITFLLFGSVATSAQGKWWKGNLHTHTFWSDGDDFPEMVANYYNTNGYHFLALSDHNILLEGEKWINIGTNKSRQFALEKYRAAFPSEVQVRTNGANLQVRLTGLVRLKELFEKRGKFLMIPSEEISAHHEGAPIHINVTNIRELIKPRTGTNVLEVMQNNIDAVLAQRQRTGQPMFPHLNHPNFHYAISAEDLMRVEGERFFEVYNGHPAVFNEGDDRHPSTERIWDIVLAWRLGILDMEPMFGIAVDDSHQYHADSPKNSNPGRGWVMVQARKLTPEHIVHAMEDGDFYATTGVQLRSVKRTANKLEVRIDPENGVDYEIRFIGTKRDFVQGQGTDGKPNVDGAKIGRELTAPVKGTKATYRLQPDDLYARALIISTKPKKNGLVTDEFERAWTQPAFPAK
jgi:hypothetical protein